MSVHCRWPLIKGNSTLKCVGTLISWPNKAGGRSQRGSPKAGTTVFQDYKLENWQTILWPSSMQLVSIPYRPIPWKVNPSRKNIYFSKLLISHVKHNSNMIALCLTMSPQGTLDRHSWLRAIFHGKTWQFTDHSRCEAHFIVVVLHSKFMITASCMQHVTVHWNSWKLNLPSQFRNDSDRTVCVGKVLIGVAWTPAAI